MVNFGGPQVLNSQADNETSYSFGHNHSFWYQQCGGYTTVFDLFKVNYEIKMFRLVDNKFWVNKAATPVTMLYAYDPDGFGRTMDSSNIRKMANVRMVTMMPGKWYKISIFFSSKYESKMKVYPTPHVFVFSNISPDTSKLSFDRWDLFHVNDQQRQIDNSCNYTTITNPTSNPLTPTTQAPDVPDCCTERLEVTQQTGQPSPLDFSPNPSIALSCENDNDSLLEFITNSGFNFI